MDEYTNEKALEIMKILGITKITQEVMTELESLVDEIYQEGFEDADEAEDWDCLDVPEDDVF
jgi:hypothetical protein